MEEYIHISVIMEELDRLLRTKQIDMIHTDLERIEQNLIKENKSFPHERVVTTQPKIVKLSFNIMKKLIFALNITFSIKDFFWWIDDEDYKYSQIFSVNFVQSKMKKQSGVQIILLNFNLIVAW